MLGGGLLGGALIGGALADGQNDAYQDVRPPLALPPFALGRRLTPLSPLTRRATRTAGAAMTLAAATWAASEPSTSRRGAQTSSSLLSLRTGLHLYHSPISLSVCNATC